MSGGFLVAASGTEDELGTIEQRVLASDPLASVLPIMNACVRHMIANSAITAPETVYAAASGKIDNTGTLIRGVALEAASGNGSVIKVLTALASLTGTVTRAAVDAG